MNFYISDLHFGHKNVIDFDHRPFRDVDEMDYTMIALWNGRVRDEDDVYIIGDFANRNGRADEWYLRQLKGRKHLIIGNHDRKMLDNPRALACLAEPPEKLAGIIDETANGDKRLVIMCHYPIASWYRKDSGAYHIFGHIHNRDTEDQRYMLAQERAINAAAALNNYTPASLDELIEHKKTYECFFHKK